MYLTPREYSNIRDAAYRRTSDQAEGKMGVASTLGLDYAREFLLRQPSSRVFDMLSPEECLGASLIKDMCPDATDAGFGVVTGDFRLNGILYFVQADYPLAALIYEALGEACLYGHTRDQLLEKVMTFKERYG